MLYDGNVFYVCVWVWCSSYTSMYIWTNRQFVMCLCRQVHSNSKMVAIASGLVLLLANKFVCMCNAPTSLHYIASERCTHTDSHGHNNDNLVIFMILYSYAAESSLLVLLVVDPIRCSARVNNDKVWTAQRWLRSLSSLVSRKRFRSCKKWCLTRSRSTEFSSVHLPMQSKFNELDGTANSYSNVFSLPFSVDIGHGW